MHEHIIEDERGDVVDVITLCSDACHRDYAGDAYAGWDGAHESEYTTWCAACGVVIPGAYADEDATCDCQRDNVIVNRFLSRTGEHCEHGNWIQLPADRLTRVSG